MFKNKTEQNRNDEKYNQTDITVKIHTNHGGVWANMIMLKSIATRSSRLSLVITIKLASETTSATFRVKNKSLLWYPFRWVEWKVTVHSRVLRRCHPERSSCSGEFGCRSFKRHSPWTVFYLVMLKNSRVFMSHILAEVHWTFHSMILY